MIFLGSYYDKDIIIRNDFTSFASFLSDCDKSFLKVIL